jgi:FKBP-type peptidyl-prolyl cis-trans isomerase
MAPRPMPMPPSFGRPPMGSQPAPEMPDKDKLSAFIGQSVGMSIKRQDLDVDPDAIAASIKATLEGHPHFSDMEFQQVYRQLQGAMRAKMMEKQKAEQEKMAKEGEENKAKAEAFLAKNATEPGVKPLPNGLQYIVEKEGSGPMPRANDTVSVKYKGMFMDGTEFDHGDSFSATIGRGVIPGWSEVLPLMKVGSQWKVFIPPDMAYGQRGSPPRIPSNSALVFDMELLSDTPPAVAPTITSSSGSSTPVVSGQIIKVPSAEELKHGAKIEVITNVPSDAK